MASIPGKDVRAGSFGGVASHYERFRPGPSATAVAWILPTRVERAVDVGAGTGALTRQLIDRADEVVAVEPDARMRAVLREQVPDAIAVEGRGESIPLPDASTDAVLASSSWHWVDPVEGVAEAGRVLRPGGVLGAIWSGPDPEGPFMSQARDLLGQRSETTTDAGTLGGLIFDESLRPEFVLRVPPGMPFGEPEHAVFTWDVALDADDLIGLLETLSWVITMEPDRRTRVIATARDLLREIGVSGDVTVDVQFRADAWRCRRDQQP
jgi:SAM-dependent methyltransferase